MEEDVTGGGGRPSAKKKPGEVDYANKAGTAWSHSYLNQKPWHPLSYPNQRRKWIAEQTHANRAVRQEEVAREFAQEQEFFRQTALFSKKEKEKLETMKAVSFMYVRPPGYNAESAKAAEIEDEKRSDPNNASLDRPEKKVEKGSSNAEKKARPKDVFGRPLPTEEDFEVLKNAPRLDTGAPVRIKPFGVEIRNVRCLRCGQFGHQSGDRECPLKDVIMPNEESRLKRDDPLTAIMAQAESSEPLKWELKQKPGMSPPRGGYTHDDPTQQIVAEDIFDEYGGFLGDGDFPSLLANFSADKPKKHSKGKRRDKHRSNTEHRESRVRHGDCQSSESSESEIDRKRLTRRKSRKEDDSKCSPVAKFHAEKGMRKLSGKERKRHSSESSFSDSESDKYRKKLAKRTRDRMRHHVHRHRGHNNLVSTNFDGSSSDCANGEDRWKPSKMHHRKSYLKADESTSGTTSSDYSHRRCRRRKNH